MIFSILKFFISVRVRNMDGLFGFPFPQNSRPPKQNSSQLCPYNKVKWVDTKEKVYPNP